MELRVWAGIGLVVLASCAVDLSRDHESEFDAVEVVERAEVPGDASAVFPPLTCNSNVFGESGFRIRVETRYNAGCQFCGPVGLFYDFGDGGAGSLSFSQPSGRAVIRHTYPSVHGAGYAIQISGESEATGATCHETIFVFFN
jgi:hypothetical protein